MKRRIIQIFIPLLVVAGAVHLAGKMSKRPDSVATGKPPKAKQRVEVYTPAPWNQPFVIHALGKTLPARELTLQTQVSGLVTQIHKQLVPGGRVRAKETLVEIDKSDYELKIKQAQAQVEQARVKVQEEQGRRTIAAKEWSLLDRNKEAKDRSGRAFALREPQLKSAKAALKAAKSVLAGAKLNRDRTTIASPLNAVVLRETIEGGQRVAPGAGIVTLAGTDQWWVQVSLSQSVQAQLEANTVQVTVHSNDDPIGISGRVVRHLPDLDEVGKMVRLIVEVDDPLRLSTPKGTPLFLGDTVQVQFHCQPKVKDLVALPQKALRPNNKIWTIDTDGALQIQTIKVFWKDEEVFLVEGLAKDTIVVSSTLTLPTPGTALLWDTPKQLQPKSTPESR